MKRGAVNLHVVNLVRFMLTYGDTQPVALVPAATQRGFDVGVCSPLLKYNPAQPSLQQTENQSSKHGTNIQPKLSKLSLHCS